MVNRIGGEVETVTDFIFLGEISSGKLEITREYFMQRWAQ